VRIKNELVSFLKQSIKNYLPEADVYLIGSRADDRQKRGDIDILVIGENCHFSLNTHRTKSHTKTPFHTPDLDAGSIGILQQEEKGRSSGDLPPFQRTDLSLTDTNGFRFLWKASDQVDERAAK